MSIWIAFLHLLFFGQSIPFPGPGMAHTSAVTPITLGVHTEADGNGNTVTTSAINTTGNCPVLIMFVAGNSITSTPTDSQSLTWTARTLYQTSPTTFGNVKVFDALNTSPSASHTFTYTETGGANSIGVACFSDVKATSPHDQENGAATASTDVTISTGNALPTLNNELVVTGTTLYITGDSIPSGFTVIDGSAYAGGAFTGLAWAYKVQTTATTENATWAGSGNNTYRAAAIETYFHD